MKTFGNLYRERENKRKVENNITEDIRDEKKMNKSSSHDIFAVTNNPPLITSTVSDDVVVSEILSRLPVKSLMRFKLACKSWSSLIQHEPHFCELHLTWAKRRPDFFIVIPIHVYDRCVGYWEYFLSLDMVEGRAAVHTVIKREKLGYDSILDPVNGLVCFLDRLTGGVRIYNSSTGELTPWIKTTINEVRKRNKFPTFGFGFDPITMEHKVICVWTWISFKTRTKYTACEILTVSNNSRRIIDEVPPYGLDGVPHYVNGSIYWIHKVFFHKDKTNWGCGTPEVIVAFDVGSEKFRAIPIPDFIIDQPPESRDLDYYRGPSIRLLDVDGRVALLCRVNRYTVSVWIFDDDHDLTEKEKIKTTATNSSNRNNWTDVTIALPFAWAGDMNVYFHTIPGTDQIIIRSDIDWLHSIYLYNCKKKTYKKVEISGMPSVSSCPSLFTALVESLPCSVAAVASIMEAS